jgi:hypothetical protein
MSDVFDSAEKNKKIAEQAKRDKQREINDLGKILKIPEGRRFIWWLLSEAKIFNNSFNLNTKLEDFNEGAKSIGLEVLNRVNKADVQAFAQMQNEYISEKKSKEELKKLEQKKEEENA